MITAPPQMGEKTKAFFERIIAWITEVSEYPGFKDWQKVRMQSILTHHLDRIDGSFPDFEFDPLTLKRHDFVMAYLELIQAAHSLRDTEFYFRRYPFRDLPISESDHFGNICDMLFSRMYQFKEKLKSVLNKLGNIQPTKINIGQTIKSFEKIFKSDLKSRNQVHHHSRYDDLDLQQINIANMMLIGSSDLIWRSLKQSSYRRNQSGWVQRTRERAQMIFALLDSISEVFDAEISFLPRTEH